MVNDGQFKSSNEEDTINGTPNFLALDIHGVESEFITLEEFARLIELNSRVTLSKTDECYTYVGNYIVYTVSEEND